MIIIYLNRCRFCCQPTPDCVNAVLKISSVASWLQLWNQTHHTWESWTSVAM